MQLKKGEVLSVKVTDIRYKKSYPSQGGGTVHIHLLDIVDSKGGKATVEYKTPKETLGDEFTKGIYQYIKVLFDDPKGAVVEPYEVEETRQPTGTSNADQPTQSQAPIHKIEKNVNMSGSSINFAMSFAKDLLAAEVANNETGYQITSDDIVRMLSWSDTINEHICKQAKG